MKTLRGAVRGAPPQPPLGRSIGRFLCVHPTTPPYEDIDDLPLLDVKQDAALRALIALRELGKTVATDPVAAFDAEPRIAELAYRWAYTDAIRKHLGRGTRPVGKIPTRPRRLSLDTLLAAWLSDALIATVPEPSDPDQLDRLEAVEADPAADLCDLWNDGIPGLELKQIRRAIALMGAIQHLKDQGATGLPDPARQRLRRLRKATRLPLRVDLL